MSVQNSTRPHSSATGRSTTGARAAAALVLGAPALVLVSELVAPRETDGLSPAAQATLLLDNSGRFAVSWTIGLLAAAMLGAGYCIAATRLTGRGRIVGRFAAGLGVLGAAGLAGHMSVSLAVRDLLLDDSGATAAADAAFNGLSAVVTVAPVVIGLNLAVLLLSIAAYHAGWAGWWVIVAGSLALVADFTPTTYNTILHAVFATSVFAAVAAHVAAPSMAD